MKGRAFYKKIDKSADLHWRGAVLATYADDSFVRIMSKSTGATYQLSGAAVQRITSKEIDELIAKSTMPKNHDGVKRVMITADMTFPWAWTPATCLGVCITKYPEREAELAPVLDEDEMHGEVEEGGDVEEDEEESKARDTSNDLDDEDRANRSRFD